MNPKHLNVRMDPVTGDLWLTEERRHKPIRKVSNITAHVLLALSAELTSVEHSIDVSRDVKFNDGHIIRITAALITEDQFNEPKSAQGDADAQHA